MKINILFCSVLLFFSLSRLEAQTNLVNKFGSGIFTFNAISMGYRIFIPENYDSLKKYPLILALHGRGERGNDNLIHIQRYGLATCWVDSVNQLKNPCFVIAPQCPDTYEGWWDWSIFTTTVALLDSTIKKYSIDANRLYVTGLSAGGWGVFMLLDNFPERFAAAIPMSAGWDPPQDVQRFKNVPVWNFHGQSDNLEPVSSSRVLMDMYPNVIYTNSNYRKAFNLSAQKINNHIQSHSNPFYSECPGISHGNWEQWYGNPVLHRWLFSKYKLKPEAITLKSLNDSSSYPVLSKAYTIHWSSESLKDSVEIWFSFNNGDDWNLIHTASNNGSYDWDLSSISDCSLGKIRLLLKDSTQNVYGIAESKLFAVNNAATNGKPLIKIVSQEFIRMTTFNIDSVNMKLIVADPEKDSVTVNLLVSFNNGMSYSCIDSFRRSVFIDTIEKEVILKDLPYSRQMILKVEISDSASTNMDSTLYFVNSKGVVTGISEPANEGKDLSLKSFQLFQNYPNPFNPLTVISYQLLTSGNVKLSIYNILGQKIKTLQNGFQKTGEYSLIWDARDEENNLASSGIYFFKLEIDNMSNYRKMILVR